MSSPVIKLKRGAFADLPTLAVGEPGFTTDRYQLFVGSPDGNKLIGGGEFWNLNSTTVGGGIRLYEATNNGSNFVELRSPATLGSNITFLLPAADGAADQVLKTDGSGNLTFAAVDSLSNAGLNNVVEDTTPQLGGNLDLNTKTINGSGNIDYSGNLTATGNASFNSGNAVINDQGASISGIVTATSFSGSVSTTDLSGTITNAQLAGSIVDSKLNQITTAEKVALSALDIDGGTDIGAAVVDADLFIVDDGGGGTNRKTTASRIKSYVLGGGGGGSTFDSVVVGSATTIDANGIDAPTGIITASSFVGNVTGDLTGTADLATTSNQVKTTTRSTNASHFLTFVDSDNGSATTENIYTDAGVTYNPSSNVLSVSGSVAADLTGDVTGNVTGSVTGTASSATAANTVFTQRNETSGTYYFTFVDDNNVAPSANTLFTDTTLNVNPSTNIVSGGGMDMVAYFINSVQITSTATELNFLDGSTDDGEVVASKAVVASPERNLIILVL